MKLSNIKKIKLDPIIAILILCLIGAFFIVKSYYDNFSSNGISPLTNNWGTFGDYIGGVVGTLFNFAGVILLYLTFRKQQETSILQQFETTFFNMLDIHRQLMLNLSGSFTIQMDHQIMEKEFTGENFLEKFSDSLQSSFIFFPVTKNYDKDLLRSDIEEVYAGHYDRYGAKLGQYYRHFYHFLKYTDEANIKDKKKYIDIIQAQMSDNELLCLCYNSISYGSLRVLPILDRYGFFENIERKYASFDHQKDIFFPNTSFKYYSLNVPLSEMD